MAAVVLLLSVYLFVRKEKTVKKKGGRNVKIKLKNDQIVERGEQNG